MYLSQARRVCPDLRIISPDIRRVSLGQKVLQESIRQFSPTYELANRGEFYVDLSGNARLFGDAATTAMRIKNEISKRYGICSVMGVATNKLVSGVAANLFDQPSIYDVSDGHERSFLAPLPVSCLPRLTRLFAPKTNETLANLEELNLRLIGHLASVSADHLHLIVGSKARLLKQWAVGIDPSPVWPEAAAPILQIWHTLESDEIDDDLLLGVIYTLLEKLCVSIRSQNRSLQKVTLTLHYSDGCEVRKQQELLPPSCLESQIYPGLHDLFLSIKRRVRVRRIGLNAEPSVCVAEQLELFREEKFSRLKNLTAAVDSVRERYGENSIRRANTSVVFHKYVTSFSRHSGRGGDSTREPESRKCRGVWQYAPTGFPPFDRAQDMLARE